MRLGALDVGSNTVRLLVADHEGSARRVLLDEARMTGLGRGLARGGALDPDALRDTVEAVRDLAARARAAGVSELLCLVTAGARSRPGAAGALEAIAAAAGAKARVLSPRQEAALAYAGALDRLPPLSGTTGVIDIGGGSTEIALGSDPMRPEVLVSLPLGARRDTEAFLRHDPATAAEMGLLRKHVATVLRRGALELLPGADRIVGVGGTIVTLGELAFGPNQAAGQLLPAGQIAALTRLLAQQPAAQRTRTLAREPGRAEVIIAGAIILQGFLETLGATGVIVSDGGIRHGVLASWCRQGLQGEFLADLPR